MSGPSSSDDRDEEVLREAVLAWFIRRGRDDWGPADELGFERWLNEDPRHREAHDRWRGHWERLAALSTESFTRPPVVSTASVSGLVSAVAPDRVAARKSEGAPTMGRRRLLWGLGGATAALGGTAIGLGVFQHWQAQQALPLHVEHFETGRGQEREVRLPDGSTVQLDTLTEVEVRYFRDRRELRLIEGQALFSVQSDARRPFEVHAGGLVATALGTRYAIRHTPRTSRSTAVDVAVEHGVVRVGRDPWSAGTHQERRPGAPDALTTRPQGGSDINAGTSATPATSTTPALAGGRDPELGAEPFVLLSAGQRVVVDAEGRRTLSELPLAEIAAWRRHRVSFVNAPLVRAIAEFERYGPTGLALNDARVGALRLSGTFDPRDAMTLRQVLPAALPVRLVSRDGAWELVLAR